MINKEISHICHICSSHDPVTYLKAMMQAIVHVAKQQQQQNNNG